MAHTNEIVELLASLGRALGASFVQVEPGVEPDAVVLEWASDPLVGSDVRTEITRLGRRELAYETQDPAEPHVAVYVHGELDAAAVGLYGSALLGELLVVARPRERPYAQWELETIRAFARVIPIAMERAAPGSPLDDLVTQIASLLLSTSATSLPATLTEVARTVAEFFEVSTAVIRSNDHERGLSLLDAEWPLREDVPAPDPLGDVPFEGPGSNPVFTATRDLHEPLIVSPHQQHEYQQRRQQGAGQAPVSLLVVPILRYGVTRGCIALIHSGARTWTKAELNALRAIASLLSQLGGRLDAEELLRERAGRDELTGLLNRRGLVEQLRARLQRVPAAPVVTVCADLDQLKALNDSFGQAGGDSVLLEVAARLRGQVASGDMVARIGAGFVILFAAAPMDPVLRTVEIIEAVTAPPFVIGESTLAAATMCAGVCVQPPDGTIDADELLRRAELALFEARVSGAGKVLAFDEQMLASSEKRNEIYSHLGNAVRDQALELYYLPELDLRTGALVAVEALVRWHHPNLGLLTPDAFISLAEESPAIMKEIGAWVLDRACAQLAAWRAEFPVIQLALRVNVSPAELMMGHVPGLVSETLIRHGLYGHDLCLEVTERTVLRELDQVLSALHAIRAMGVTIALDDFGTGYSTLTQLRQLPVDTLKMDRQFIKELALNKADLVIVESTVQLAHNFGLEVVAEGVDSPYAARELLRMGCYRAQGQLFHTAAPAAAIRDLIAWGGFNLPALGLG